LERYVIIPIILKHIECLGEYMAEDIKQPDGTRSGIQTSAERVLREAAKQRAVYSWSGAVATEHTMNPDGTCELDCTQFNQTIGLGSDNGELARKQLKRFQSLPPEEREAEYRTAMAVFNHAGIETIPSQA
jgi:hypothetical protein